MEVVVLQGERARSPNPSYLSARFLGPEGEEAAGRAHGGGCGVSSTEREGVTWDEILVKFRWLPSGPGQRLKCCGGAVHFYLKGGNVRSWY